jgi:hypothetical protein
MLYQGKATPEYFTFQFDDALDEMFSKGTGLAGTGCLGRRRNHLAYLWRDSPHFDRHYRWPHNVLPSHHPGATRMMMGSDYWWAPLPHMRLVFKALAYAENEFACSYPRLGSNEERLTGHLLSECFCALRAISGTVEDLLSQQFGVRMELELVYSDLSAGSVVGPDGKTTMQEKITGADFALLVTHQVPGGTNSVTTGTAFQAKKVENDSADICLPQLAALGKNSGWDGSRYCFYDMNPQRCLAPFTVEPGDIWRLDGNPRKGESLADLPGTPFQAHKKSLSINPLKLGRETLAEYLVFGMMVRGAGASFESPREAYQNVVRGGDGGAPAGRVLALTFRPHQPEGENVSMLRYIEG